MNLFQLLRNIIFVTQYVWIYNKNTGNQYSFPVYYSDGYWYIPDPVNRSKIRLFQNGATSITHCTWEPITNVIEKYYDGGQCKFDPHLTRNRMKTLDEYNREKHYKPEAPQRNGIACPNCKRELVDEDNNVLLTHPPKKWVKCTECDYTGIRIV